MIKELYTTLAEVSERNILDHSIEPDHQRVTFLVSVTVNSIPYEFILPISYYHFAEAGLKAGYLSAFFDDDCVLIINENVEYWYSHSDFAKGKIFTTCADKIAVRFIRTECNAKLAEGGFEWTQMNYPEFEQMHFFDQISYLDNARLNERFMKWEPEFIRNVVYRFYNYNRKDYCRFFEPELIRKVLAEGFVSLENERL